MKSNKEIIAQFKKHHKITQARLAKQYANTKRCQSFEAGDLMSYEDRYDIPTRNGKKRKALVKFNKIKPYVNAVKGFMTQNRRQGKYEARIQNDKLQELFTGYANGIAGYVRDNANADQEETQQNGDLLINGYGALETALTYGDGYASTEAEGGILMGRIDPLMVGWDPYAKKTNLLDRRWDYSWRDYEYENAKQLFDNAKEEDFESTNDDDGSTSQNYEFLPNGGKYDKIAPVEWADKDKNMVRVFFYQWYDVETYYKCANPLFMVEDQQTAQVIDIYLQSVAKEQEDFDPRAEILSFNEDVKKQLEEHFGDILGELFEYRRKVYYTAVLSGKKVFNAYKNISQQGSTLQFKTGDYDAVNGIWTGMVNSMMEPALYYCKALTELMFTIAANSKGGVYVEKGAVEDITEFEQGYGRTDAVVEVEEGAVSGQKIQDKARPALPTGLEGIIQISDQALTDVTGLDPTFLGSREFANDTAAFQRQRIKQFMSVLATYVDSEGLYQKIQSRILLDLMRVFVQNNENMTIRVIGEEGKAMFLRLSEKQLSTEYDVTVSEAPLTQQDKEEQAKILTGMGDKLIMTDPIAAKTLYAMAAELMPLDYSIKERIKAVLTPEKEEIDPALVEQMQQELAALKDGMNQAQIAAIVSQAGLNNARKAEAMAKVSNTQASTTKILEEAKNKSLENQVIRDNPIGEIKTNISI